MTRTISVYRSRPKNLRIGNFGDEITQPIFERIFGVHAVPVPMHRAEVIATGSILDSYWRARPARQLLTRMLRSQKELHVWGSGFMLANSYAKWPSRLVLHAVRGELTSKRLSFNGPVGDPGILASQLISGPTEKKYAVGLVPHFVDEDFANKLILPPHWKLIHTDNSVDDVLSAIAASEIVVSSSLHGLITADSFGVPAIWAASHNELSRGADYKFHDYASSRMAVFNTPLSYQEILDLKPADRVGLATKSARDIKEWQAQLISSFPFN